jgi:thioredoxin reductase (NADPH)
MENSTKNNYDIAIIGGGPIGLACGLAAKRAGLSYVILEKGCLVNSLYNYPANMTFFSTSDRLEIGNVPFVSNSVKPTRSEALEYYRRVTDANLLNIRLYEEVVDIVESTQNLKLAAHNSPNTEGGYLVQTTRNQYLAQHIILATGFYDLPNRLDIAGEDLPKVTHYYQEPHPYYGQKVVVVGANNSAVDAALETYRKGAEVTMVVRKQEIGQRVKYWVRPDIVNRITEGSVKAYFESHLVTIRPQEVDIQTPEGLVTLANDFVIAATGYQPNFDFLQKVGIELSNDHKRYPTYDKTTQETNRKNIFLAGVICGGMDTHVWFIENSRIHAEQIITAILSKKTMQ